MNIAIIRRIVFASLFVSALVLVSCDWFESGGGGSSDEIDWDGGGGSVPQDDGLPDAYEVSGETYYGMDLYGMGARADQVDLFVHVLTMDDVSDDGMKLQKAALDKVVDAFLEVGVHVHFDVGPVNCLYDGDSLVADFSDYNLGSGVATHVVAEYDSSTKPGISLSSTTNSGDDSQFLFVDELREGNTYFETDEGLGIDDTGSENRNYAFYLLAFGGSQEEDGSGGSSGLAWVGGRDFLVALGGWDFSFTPTTAQSNMGITEDSLKNYVANKQASTIMHEFGHNLGLLHGGDESLNYKPNYYSIMNYLYQMEGLPSIGNREGDRYYYERMWDAYGSGEDYSSWLSLMNTSNFNGYSYSLEYDFNNGPFSDSFSMNYSHGYGGPKKETNIYESTGLRQSGSGSVDFNGSGSISDGITENINPSYDSTYDTHYDHDDWANLEYYYAKYTGGGRSLVDSETVLEVAEEYDMPMNFLAELEYRDAE